MDASTDGSACVLVGLGGALTVCLRGNSDATERACIAGTAFGGGVDGAGGAAVSTTGVGSARATSNISSESSMTRSAGADVTAVVPGSSNAPTTPACKTADPMKPTRRASTLTAPSSG